MQKRSFLAVILGLVAILMFALSGCGSSGPMSSGGSFSFGSLTLSGSGSATTGTQFLATYRVPAFTSGNLTSYNWLSNTNSLGLMSYPYGTVNVVTNNGLVQQVMFSWTTAPTAGSIWAVISASPGAIAVPGVAISGTSATFNNVVLTNGMNGTTLTLTGTLN